MDAKAHEELFLAIGLKPNTVKSTLANPKVTATLAEVLKHVNVTKCDEKKGALLYRVATAVPESIEKRRNTLAEYVATGKIASAAQFDLAITYLKGHLGDKEIDFKDFDTKIGVGVTVTEKDVSDAVDALLKEHAEELKTQRYTVDLGAYLRKLREKLPFAEGGVLTKTFNDKIAATLGPQTEEDKKMKEGKKKKDEEHKKEEKAAHAGQEDDEEDKDDGDFVKKKLSELIARDLASAINPPEVLKKHLEFTGGKVMTRFPPEPNGYLHIGHAKAMRFSFRVAQEYEGHTYLRYDDTNPEKETTEYIVNIEKNVRWLGYEPWKITHASDHFQTLYNCAVELIKKDKAFICHQSGDEMHEFRRAGRESPFRNRPIEDSLRIFDEMRRGLWEEGSACLRLKIDMNHKNTTMRDPVAYRIKFVPHPHVGDKWCIYPIYDFTHCINDSLENITHSLCTLEFEIRRDLYYWTLEQLGLFRPFVWEFSRLNISNTVLSKRKLHKLVFENKVKGWDDPRIMTLNGLRRRGYTAAAINEFCDLVSVTRRGNENMISLNLLEFCCRQDLDHKARRTMVVLEPVKIVFKNVEDSFEHKSSSPYFPKDPTKGGNDIHLYKEVYVDKSDVKLHDVEGFYGIAPGKVVGLKYAFNFKVLEVQADAKGEPNLVVAELLKDQKTPKPKTYLHWVSVKESMPCEVRLYDVLFTAHNPNEIENWFEAVNPDSLIVKPNAVMNKYLSKVAVEDHYQFERIGFFVVDQDSKPASNYFVWNRTVTLVDRERKKVLAKAGKDQ